ncbi:MAG: hypothetical protein ACLR4Z_00500 [Butyricicoccaceae bacterium]
MQWTTDIDPAGLIIALERLEDRFQKGERSVKLQAEAQQIIRQVQAAQSVQKNWRTKSLYRAHRLMEQKETEAE